MRRGDWMLLDRVDIPAHDTDATMFTRWRLVQTPWFGLWVHRHHLPDQPVLHDHPRPFVSIRLRGGYWERFDYMRPPRRVRWVNVKRALDCHYIERLDREPTWTFVLAGRRQRTWGYIVPVTREWVPFHEHPLGQRFDDAMGTR